ncbi:hypothetical protein RS030_4598 [Cryptosporidium xiaoi]|uniref:ABC transporter family protein n=1 Tax=Cryptosporidium xiaoi TaxID=659607 RepID=A0AAV9XVF1_9CRYT
MLDLLSVVWLSKWSKYITNNGSNPGYPLLFRGDSPTIWINKLRESLTKHGNNSFWTPILDVYGKSIFISLILKLLFLLSCSLCSYIFGLVASNKQGVFGSCILIVTSYLLKSVLDAHNRLYISRLTIRIESGLTGVIFHRLLSYKQNHNQNLTSIGDRECNYIGTSTPKKNIRLEIQCTPQKCSSIENLNFIDKEIYHYNNEECNDNIIVNNINVNGNNKVENGNVREENMETESDGEEWVLLGYKRSLNYLLSDPDVFSMLVGDITSVQYFLNSMIDIMLLPISVLLTWTLLEKQVGFTAALPGIVTFVLLLLTSFGFQIIGTIYKAPFMENRDKRLSLCHDILGALKLIRIMGAEDLAYNKLIYNRKIETDYNKKRLIRTQFGSFLEYYTQKTTQLIVFILFYTLSSKSLNISSILTSIHILHSFSSPLRGIPVTFIEGLISILRIKTFIFSHLDDYSFRYDNNNDEESTNCDFNSSNNINIREDRVLDFFIRENSQNRDGKEYSSYCGKISSCKEERVNESEVELIGEGESKRIVIIEEEVKNNVLRDVISVESTGNNVTEGENIGDTSYINESKRIVYNYLKAHGNSDGNIKGRCVIITGGSHGCGKTSIINSILDQKHSNACYAYTNQASIWLPQGTVRSSILFGKELDENLYERVITVCQLKDDFSSWKDGDLRVIDEGGSSLSGGQKTRVSLARCLYYINEASLFLFDDIFLNLDPNVAIKIFNDLFSENGFLVNSNVVLTIDLTSLLYFINNSSVCSDNWTCMYIIHLNNQNIFFSGPVYSYLSMINNIDNCCLHYKEYNGKIANSNFHVTLKSKVSFDSFKHNKGYVNLDESDCNHQLDDTQRDYNEDSNGEDENNSNITTCSDYYYNIDIDEHHYNFVDYGFYGYNVSKEKDNKSRSYSFNKGFRKIYNKLLKKRSFSFSNSYSLFFNAGPINGRKRGSSLENNVSKLTDIVKRSKIKKTVKNRKKNKTSVASEHCKSSASAKNNIVNRDKRNSTVEEKAGELEIIQHINSHISTISSKNLSIESFHSLICTTPKSSYTSMSYSNSNNNTNNCSVRPGKLSFNNGKTTFIKSSEMAQAESLPSDLITEIEIMERIAGGGLITTTEIMKKGGMLKNIKHGRDDEIYNKDGGNEEIVEQGFNQLNNNSNAIIYDEDGSNISFFSKFGLKYLFGYYYISRFGISGRNKKICEHDLGNTLYTINTFSEGKTGNFGHNSFIPDQPPHIPNPITIGDGYTFYNNYNNRSNIVSTIKDGAKIYIWYLELIGKRWCIFLLLSCILKSVLDRFSDAYISGVENGNDNVYFIVIYAFIVIMQGLLGSFLFVGEAIGGVKASNKAHDQLLEMVFYSPFWFYDSTPVQYLMNRLSTDILVMDELPLKKIASVIVPGVDYIMQIIMLTYIAPLSLPVTLIVILITYKVVCTSYITTNVRAQKIALSVLSPMYGLFSQIINGIVTIYAFNAQKHIVSQFYMQIEHLQRIRLLQHISSQWAAIRLQLYTIPLVVFITFVPIQESSSRYLALLYSLFISDTTSIITYKYSAMERDMCSGERIYQLVSRINDNSLEKNSNNINVNSPGNFKNNGSVSINLPCGVKRNIGPVYNLIPDIKDEGNKHYDKEKVQLCGNYKNLNSRTGLAIIDLDVGYYDVKGTVYNSILSEININVGPNQHIGVVGRTGSGKSTLVLALLGLIEYKKGQITLDDVPISSLSTRERKDVIGILPQTPLVLKDWTIRDFLDPYNEFSDEDIYDGINKCFIDYNKRDLDQNIDLYSNVNLLPESLLRLYSIARLIINSKKYRMILIDEPPPSLNGNFGLQNNINLIVNTHFKHCNVFIIAHHVESIKYCDYVWILAKQKIANIIHPSLIPTQLDLAQILTDYGK